MLPIPSQTRHLYLTGRPGVGKTTLVNNLLQTLPAAEVNGFLTGEIREKGQRQGFIIQTLDGFRTELAHRNFKSLHRVGAYGVRTGALEQVREILTACPPPRLWILDEVGKMERCIPEFEDFLFTILRGDVPTLATVPIRADAKVASLLQEPDSYLITVTPENRNMLAAALTEWVSTILSTD